MDMANKLPAMQNQYGQGSNGIYYGPTSANTGAAYSWGPAIDTLFWNGVPNQWDAHGNIIGATQAAHTPGAIPVTPYNPEDFFVTGNTFNNNIAVSSSSENSGYRMSIGNVSQTGIEPGTDYYKTNVSLSGDINLSKKIKVSGIVTYIKSSKDEEGHGTGQEAIKGPFITPPTFDNKNGSNHPINDSSAYVLPAPLSTEWLERNYSAGIGGPNYLGYDNPYWDANMNPFHQDLDRVIGSMVAEYKLCDWMTITYRLGGDVYEQNESQAVNTFGLINEGSITQQDYYNSQFNSDFIINMKKKINKDFSASLILGQNYFTTFSNLNSMSGTNFVLPTYFSFSNAQNFTASKSETEIRRSAWYGEADLGFKDQLYLSLTGRDETSSTLPVDNDNFFYPSASLSWVFTEPLGLSSNKIFPYGKVRFSYADVGKDAAPHSLQTYYAGASGFPYNGDAGYVLSQTVGNPNLIPERTTSYETGIDLAFFQNRISINATYYNEKSSDIIVNVPIAYNTGFSSATLNAATITNNGYELSLNTTPVKMKNGFVWNLNFNWSKNNNLVTAIYPGITSQGITPFIGAGNGIAIYAGTGYPYGVIAGTTYQNSILNNLSSPVLIDDVKTDAGYGMPLVSSKDTAIGNIQPKWLGSMVNNFSYKGFTLGIQIDVRHGGQIFEGTEAIMDYYGTGIATANRNSSTVFSGVMGHLNAAGQVVHFDANGNVVAGPGNANTMSAVENEYYWQHIGTQDGGAGQNTIQDGGYVKLRQLSLTYQLPQAVVHKLHLQKVAITFYMNNIILAAKSTGVDPETSNMGPTNGQGMDYFNTPGIKSYGLRLNVGI